MKKKNAYLTSYSGVAAWTTTTFLTPVLFRLRRSSKTKYTSNKTQRQSHAVEQKPKKHF